MNIIYKIKIGKKATLGDHNSISTVRVATYKIFGMVFFVVK